MPMPGKTNREGLAGYVVVKTGEMPEIENNDFLFVNVDVNEFEKLETEYDLSEHAQVQYQTMRCGKKRRSHSNNSTGVK